MQLQLVFAPLLCYIGPIRAEGSMLMKKLAVSQKVLLCMVAVLLIVCIALSLVIFCDYRAEKQAEEIYMANLYVDLRDIRAAASELAAEGPSPEAPSIPAALLCNLLRKVEEDLLDGYRYVSDRIQSVSAIWFSGASADISNSLSPRRGITDETILLLEQLSADMDTLVNQMVGPDGLNIDPELTIAEFSDIIYQFYQKQ